MSTYLDKLIESIKRELEQEEARLQTVTFRQKVTEAREISALKRLHQRLDVLEQLRSKEPASKRKRREPRGEAAPTT
jgi:hypothetical protein